MDPKAHDYGYSSRHQHTYTKQAVDQGFKRKLELVNMFNAVQMNHVHDSSHQSEGQAYHQSVMQPSSDAANVQSAAR